MKLIATAPEGVRFQITLAGPASRFLAWAMDMVVIQAAINVFGQVLGFFVWIQPDTVVAFYIIATFVATMGYGILLEWLWKGQTIGKRMLKIYVMDEGALPLTFTQSLLRNALRAVDMLPGLYLCGGVSAILTRKCQRLGDIAARTVVARHVTAPVLDFRQAEKGKYNSMKDARRHCAQLRQAVSAEEAGLALQSLLRRDQLDDAARVTLFRAFRERLEAAVRFPESVTLGLSDERYVRNAVEILYDRRDTAAAR